MTRPAVHRPVPSGDDGALAVVAVPRALAGDWPGDGPVAQVPAVLLLAMTGRCCCDDLRRRARPPYPPGGAAAGLGLSEERGSMGA